MALGHVERGQNGFLNTTTTGVGVKKQETEKRRQTERAKLAPCQVLRKRMRDSKWGKKQRERKQEIRQRGTMNLDQYTTKHQISLSHS